MRHVDSQALFSGFLFFLKSILVVFGVFGVPSPYILIWFEWNYGINKRTIIVSLPQSCRCGGTDGFRGCGRPACFRVACIVAFCHRIVSVCRSVLLPENLFYLGFGKCGRIVGDAD